MKQEIDTKIYRKHALFGATDRKAYLAHVPIIIIINSINFTRAKCNAVSINYVNAIKLRVHAIHYGTPCVQKLFSVHDMKS